MKNIVKKKVVSAMLAVVMLSLIASQPLSLMVYATDGYNSVSVESGTTEIADSNMQHTDTADDSDVSSSANDVNADSSSDSALQPQADIPSTRPAVICGMCGQAGHAITSCPQQCTVHGTAHTEADCIRNAAANNNIYISNYQIVNDNGSALAKVNPGDKVIVAVSVIDERIKADEFGVPAGQSTGRIHINMTQGAFSIPTSAVIDVKMRNPVTVTNAEGISYQAISYTVSFRDVTYLGGNPSFSFGISYTGKNGTNTNDNMPLPYPHTTLDMKITQATDDVPAPTIILNSANYGKVAIIGEPFALSTVATNTSTNLELDNVSLKIVLPNGITLANGNSQVLIGKVGKGGEINHTFTLIAEGVANDITSLPIQLVYTFEAFVGGQRTQFTSQQDVSINVQQPTRFDIQSIFNDLEMYMGNESYMSASLVNKGKTTVYNVTAELVSDTLTAYEVEFLGNIMPGSTAEAEFDFTASQVGTSTGKLLVIYEDATGTQYTIEREFTIEVLEEMVWDKPVVDMPVVEPAVEKTSFVPYVIVAVVIAAGGFFFWKKKKKAKRLAELGDEDEDI